VVIELKEYNTSGIDYASIFALILSTKIHLFTIIFIFVMLGNICRDYLMAKDPIKIIRIAVASFIVAWSVFLFVGKIENFNLLLLYAYLGGVATFTIHSILDRSLTDENIVRNILIKIFSSVGNLSNIFEDNKDNK